MLDSLIRNLGDIILQFGYWGIFFLMVLEGMCVPIPSEILLGFAGYLVSQGKMNATAVIVSSSLGSTTGAIIAYTLARVGGRPLLDRCGCYIGLTAEKIAVAESWFARMGARLIPAWRQLPIVRNKISLVAGVMCLPFPTFVIYTVAGILLWVSLATMLGIYFGNNWEQLGRMAGRLGYALLGGLAALFLLWRLYRHCRCNSRKG